VERVREESKDIEQGRLAAPVGTQQHRQRCERVEANISERAVVPNMNLLYPGAFDGWHTITLQPRACRSPGIGPTLLSDGCREQPRPQRKRGERDVMRTLNPVLTR
jgi:hypothetical protein